MLHEHRRQRQPVFRLFDGLDDPSRLAIEQLDGTRISYRDLIAQAGRMANLLVSRGVKPGDRVAAQTEKSVPGLVLYLAAVRAGAVYLRSTPPIRSTSWNISSAMPSRRWWRAIPQKPKGLRDRGTSERQGRDPGRRRQGIADGCCGQGWCGIQHRRARQ